MNTRCQLFSTRILVSIFSLLLLISSGTGHSAQPHPLDIYWIDVDGGAATLLVTPAGESILIDAGENQHRHASRIQEVAVKVAGLKAIDHFVATHWHSDHFGGVYKLSRLIPIKAFYDHGDIPSNLPEDPNFPVLMPLYEKATQGRHKPLKAGDLIALKQTPGSPGLLLRCLASDKKVLSETKAEISDNPACDQKKAGPTDETDNAKSVVLLLKYGNFSFLDTGDLTWAMEEKLICPKNLIGTVDVFQIGHHGLDLSNNPVLIESIRPRVVVLNNAPKKGAEPNSMQTLRKTAGIETIWQLYRNVQIGKELNTDPQSIANPPEGGESRVYQSFRAGRRDLYCAERAKRHP